MRYIFSNEIKSIIITNKLVKKSDIMDIFNNYSITLDFYDYMEYHKNHKNMTFKQMVYHFLMDDTLEIQTPKCLYCNNDINRFYPHKMEYASYCCKHCSDLSPIKHMHEMETNLKKYGVVRWTNREKSKKTCQIKYGKNITNPSQLDNVKNKKIQSMQLHYGVNNPGQISNHNEKCKNAWLLKTEEERKIISQNRYYHTNFEERTKNTIKTIQEKYGDDITNISQIEIIKEKKANKQSSSTKKARETLKLKFKQNYEYIKSIYNITPKKGGVISNIEMNFYEYLICKYNPNDIIPQYNDEIRYPFNCDFYISSLDLFIEIQGTWTHGGHPFNKKNTNDINQVNIWKSKKSKYYDTAINIWTKSDVKKRQTAYKNKLNYLEIFTKDINIAINTFENFINQ